MGTKQRLLRRQPLPTPASPLPIRRPRTQAPSSAAMCSLPALQAAFSPPLLLGAAPLHTPLPLAACRHDRQLHHRSAASVQCVSPQDASANPLHSAVSLFSSVFGFLSSPSPSPAPTSTSTFTPESTARRSRSDGETAAPDSSDVDKRSSDNESSDEDDDSNDDSDDDSIDDSVDDDDDDDDDGIQTRIQARKDRSQPQLQPISSSSSSPAKRKRPGSSIFPFFSLNSGDTEKAASDKGDDTAAAKNLKLTHKPLKPTSRLYPNAMHNLPEYKLFYLMNTALDRRAEAANSNSNRNQPNQQQQKNRRRQQQQPQPQEQQLSTILSYDLQRSIFDDLTDKKQQGKQESQPSNSNKNQPPTSSIWERSSRLVLDTFRFITFQQEQPSKQTVNTYSTIAAMANDDDTNSTAIAYAAAAAAIALSSSDDVKLTAKETEALEATVKAAKTIKTSEDAIKFNDTLGLQSLVKAANVLKQSDKSAALTCLANVAIVLPKARKQMLLVTFNNNDSVITSTIANVVLDAGLDEDDASLWFVEALVSSIHLMGSLALGKAAECKRFRALMARDAQIVHRLEKLSGGMQTGQAEGAARAARRCLGALGVNKWTAKVSGQKGLRILSIDGGGTRAILAFETLKHLKRLTGCEIHELFDIIGGTSTGAIVATSIGISHKNVETVELLYRDMIGKVFAKHPVNGPKMLLTKAYYDTNVLESTLQKECGRSSFIDSRVHHNMNKVFVVSSVMSRDPKELFVFRNYTYPLGHESRYDGTTEAQLWEGLRASSAAPTFFSEININGELHADGAIVANNPTAVALHETRCMFPGVPIEVVVSLGNGVAKPTKPSSSSLSVQQQQQQEQKQQDEQQKQQAAAAASTGSRGSSALQEMESWTPEDDLKNKNMGWGDVVGSIVASATSTETVHYAMQDLFPDDKYFRFNPETDSNQIDETSPETLAMFVTEAQEYIAQHKDEFERVARILRPKSPQSLWARFKDALRRELDDLDSKDWDDDLYLPN